MFLVLLAIFCCYVLGQSLDIQYNNAYDFFSKAECYNYSNEEAQNCALNYLLSHAIFPQHNTLYDNYKETYNFITHDSANFFARNTGEEAEEWARNFLLLRYNETSYPLINELRSFTLTSFDVSLLYPWFYDFLHSTTPFYTEESPWECFQSLLWFMQEMPNFWIYVLKREGKLTIPAQTTETENAEQEKTENIEQTTKTKNAEQEKTKNAEQEKILTALSEDKEKSKQYLNILREQVHNESFIDFVKKSSQEFLYSVNEENKKQPDSIVPTEIDKKHDNQSNNNKTVIQSDSISQAIKKASTQTQEEFIENLEKAHQKNNKEYEIALQSDINFIDLYRNIAMQFIQNRYAFSSAKPLLQQNEEAVQYITNICSFYSHDLEILKSLNVLDHIIYQRDDAILWSQSFLENKMGLRQLPLVKIYESLYLLAYNVFKMDDESSKSWSISMILKHATYWGEDISLQFMQIYDFALNNETLQDQLQASFQNTQEASIKIVQSEKEIAEKWAIFFFDTHVQCNLYNSLLEQYEHYYSLFMSLTFQKMTHEDAIQKAKEYVEKIQ